MLVFFVSLVSFVIFGYAVGSFMLYSSDRCDRPA